MKNLIKTEIIEKYRVERKLSKREFCNTLNINYIDYINLLNKNYDIELIVLFKIAKSLNMNICDLICN